MLFINWFLFWKFLWLPVVIIIGLDVLIHQVFISPVTRNRIGGFHF